MSSQRAQQTEDLYFRVLRRLQDKPDATQRELADELGVSHGKMNYCLKALVDKGLVKLGNFKSSQRKLKYAYLLTPAGLAEKAKLTRRFLQRKVAEYDQLKAEIAALKRELPERRKQNLDASTRPPRHHDITTPPPHHSDATTGIPSKASHETLPSKQKTARH